MNIKAFLIVSLCLVSTIFPAEEKKRAVETEPSAARGTKRPLEDLAKTEEAVEKRKAARTEVPTLQELVTQEAEAHFRMLPQQLADIWLHSDKDYYALLAQTKKLFKKYHFNMIKGTHFVDKVDTSIVHTLFWLAFGEVLAVTDELSLQKKMDKEVVDALPPKINPQGTLLACTYLRLGRSYINLIELQNYAEYSLKNSYPADSYRFTGDGKNIVSYNLGKRKRFRGRLYSPYVEVFDVSDAFHPHGFHRIIDTDSIKYITPNWDGTMIAMLSIKARCPNELVFWHRKTDRVTGITSHLHGPLLEDNIAKGIAINKQGTLIAYILDRGIVGWDFTRDESYIVPTEQAKQFFGKELRALAFDPKGTKLVAAEHHGKLSLYDFDTKETRSLNAFGGKDEVKDLIFSPDGSKLLCIKEKSVRLFDFKTEREEVLLEDEFGAEPFVRFSPTGTICTITKISGRYPSLCNLETKKCYRLHNLTDNGTARAFFNPAGKLLFVEASKEFNYTLGHFEPEMSLDQLFFVIALYNALRTRNTVSLAQLLESPVLTTFNQPLQSRLRKKIEANIPSQELLDATHALFEEESSPSEQEQKKATAQQTEAERKRIYKEVAKGLSGLSGNKE